MALNRSISPKSYGVLSFASYSKFSSAAIVTTLNRRLLFIVLRLVPFTLPKISHLHSINSLAILLELNLEDDQSERHATTRNSWICLFTSEYPDRSSEVEQAVLGLVLERTGLFKVRELRQLPELQHLGQRLHAGIGDWSKNNH